MTHQGSGSEFNKCPGTSVPGRQQALKFAAVNNLYVIHVDLNKNADKTPVQATADMDRASCYSFTVDDNF